MGGSMSAAELLMDLGLLGIRLQADGDRLRYHPRSALTPDLLARLKAHKADVLALLRPTPDDAPSVEPTDAAVVWQAVLDRLEGDPLFPPDTMETLRAARVKWASDAPQTTPTKPVCRCGSTTWRDVPIHGGQSVRRDCGRCERFLDFPVWYGKYAGQNGQHLVSCSHGQETTEETDRSIEASNRR